MKFTIGRVVLLVLAICFVVLVFGGATSGIGIPLPRLFLKWSGHAIPEYGSSSYRRVIWHPWAGVFEVDHWVSGGPTRLSFLKVVLPTKDAEDFGSGDRKVSAELYEGRLVLGNNLVVLVGSIYVKDFTPGGLYNYASQRFVLDQQHVTAAGIGEFIVNDLRIQNPSSILTVGRVSGAKDPMSWVGTLDVTSFRSEYRSPRLQVLGVASFDELSVSSGHYVMPGWNSIEPPAGEENSEPWTTLSLINPIVTGFGLSYRAGVVLDRTDRLAGEKIVTSEQVSGGVVSFVQAKEESQGFLSFLVSQPLSFSLFGRLYDSPEEVIVDPLVVDVKGLGRLGFSSGISGPISTIGKGTARLKWAELEFVDHGLLAKAAGFEGKLYGLAGQSGQETLSRVTTASIQNLGLSSNEKSSIMTFIGGGGSVDFSVHPAVPPLLFDLSRDSVAGLGFSIRVAPPLN